MVVCHYPAAGSAWIEEARAARRQWNDRSLLSDNVNIADSSTAPTAPLVLAMHRARALRGTGQSHALGRKCRTPSQAAWMPPS
eukprot:3537370-Rhodomonas_salina.2